MRVTLVKVARLRSFVRSFDLCACEPVRVPVYTFLLRLRMRAYLSPRLRAASSRSSRHSFVTSSSNAYNIYALVVYVNMYVRARVCIVRVFL